MAPLIVLVVGVLLARSIGQLGVAQLRDWTASTRVGLAVMLCFTAAAHFNSMRPDMIAMVPPSVPRPEFMVTFTGICEILGAVGLLVPRTRRIAAVALIVYMLAVLPANIYAAQTGASLRGAPVTPLIPRIALQVLFIALLWWSGARKSRSHNAASIYLCIAAIAVPQLLAAQKSPGDTRATQSADSASIAVLEQRVEDAVVRRHAAFLDSIYAPTFRFKHSTGTLESREQRMANMRRPVPPNAPGRTISRTVDSTDVEVHGDVALSTGRIHVIREGGNPKWRNYTVRYARVWRRDVRTGRWQLLTHHTTSESSGSPEPIRP